MAGGKGARYQFWCGSCGALVGPNIRRHTEPAADSSCPRRLDCSRQQSHMPTDVDNSPIRNLGTRLVATEIRQVLGRSSEPLTGAARVVRLDDGEAAGPTPKPG